MAANPTIFENIRLPKEEYKMIWLSWIIPNPSETLDSYAKRMVEDFNKEEPVVLIGVSFGGVLVQEMSKLVCVKKLIIISSVKSKHEFPKRMKIARYTGVYKILPTGFLDYMTHIERLPLGNSVRKRIKLYQQYLSVSDKSYLDWAIEQMLCWEQSDPIHGIIHIHGDEDLVFPIKNIENCIVIPKGTHIMVITKFKWFNENLPKLISE